MAWGRLDYHCSKCDALYADNRSRDLHEDECKGEEDSEPDIDRARRHQRELVQRLKRMRPAVKLTDGEMEEVVARMSRGL